MDGLVGELLAGKNVVFITGAGLSVSSGIPPYRGQVRRHPSLCRVAASKPLIRVLTLVFLVFPQDDATWSKFVTSWGTRRKFNRDPIKWWNTFWLQTHAKVRAGLRNHTTT